MILRYFSPSLVALTLAAFGSQIVVTAQQAGPTPAQTTPPQAQSAPQQLPEAPAPRGASLAATSPESSSSAAPPGSSYSSSAATPRFWSGNDPNAQVTVLENTLFRVRTNRQLRSRRTREDTPLSFTLSQDVVVDGILIIPRGAVIHGKVIESRQAGALSGSPEMILQLTSLDLAGRNYPLYSYQFKVTGASKTRPTEFKIKSGAIVGAVAGAVLSGTANGETTAAGRLAGAGAGAAVGAGVGAAVSLATPGPILDIPAESEMDFFLASPISVVPVTQREAARLSQGLNPGGPVLYVRGETP